MKTAIMKRIITAGVMILLISCTNNGGAKMNDLTVFPKGDKAGNQIFTNTVWVKMMLTDQDSVFDTQAYNVTFEPAGRTHWHSHPGGQLLFATKGEGYYQEKDKPAQLLKEGDMVAIPPNVVHWHGAGPVETFVHLGMSTKVHLGPAEWFGPVTDEEYAEATSKQ